MGAGVPVTVDRTWTSIATAGEAAELLLTPLQGAPVEIQFGTTPAATTAGFSFSGRITNRIPVPEATDEVFARSADTDTDATFLLAKIPAA